MNVLIIAAHPDDEVLGCGGTAARLAAEGHEIIVLILGEGATSRRPSKESANRSEVSALAKMSQRAAAILGLAEVVQAGLPDNRFDSLDLLDVVKCVETQIDHFKPQRVYTHHPGDLNVDHEITARAALTATRTLPGQTVRELYCFEIPSSTEWSFQRRNPIFVANAFVAIQATLERKVEALAAYESEMRSFPHPRSAEAVRAYATRWGSVAGVESAEAFELIRSVTT
jgi:LmbE family N-acetylglucosaminyl deacetylase